MSLYVYNMYKNKKADVVMNSADISIWIAVDDQMNEDGAKAMMDSGIEAFTSSQEEVNVNYKFIPEDQYGSELLKAYENGRDAYNIPGSICNKRDYGGCGQRR